ncbi:Tc5 transposase DNA-binding domain-containing protein [Zalerion maritima]|uniref:Tc5 transposase DNA-binding domain-containing protein n=1 Tax=Zalerion maritima TaxID=339359 RepID=A0AAD5RY23_9PEZI|nr:Tc5 transposase DNA-binding domain-containing protein [Zalerion maritima]
MPDDGAIAKALHEVGSGTSIRSAARQFKIPYSTLRGRVAGIQGRQSSHESQMFLTNGQESTLKSWIYDLNKENVSPSHSMVRKLACDLRYDGAIPEGSSGPGHNWVTRFIKRFPELKTRQAHGAASATIVNTTSEVRNAHVTKFSDPPHNIILSTPQNVKQFDALLHTDVWGPHRQRLWRRKLLKGYEQMHGRRIRAEQEMEALRKEIQQKKATRKIDAMEVTASQESIQEDAPGGVVEEVVPQPRREARREAIQVSRERRSARLARKPRRN